jgi:hypothetical protein
MCWRQSWKAHDDHVQDVAVVVDEWEKEKDHEWVWNLMDMSAGEDGTDVDVDCNAALDGQVTDQRNEDEHEK